MNPIALDGPAVEPVSLAEMKAHLRLDGPDEDDLVSALVSAARMAVEGATRLVLIEQTWRFALRSMPLGGVIDIPLAPVMAVSAVRTVDLSGMADLVDPSSYRLDTGCDPTRLLLSGGDDALDRRRLEVDLTCGFGSGPEAVPRPLRLGIMRLVTRWHMERGDAPDPTGTGLPADIRVLLAPYVRRRLR